MVDQKIIRELHRIIDSIQKISDGDFNISLNERGNEELITNQNKDMENNLVLIANIKAVCANLDAASQDTLSTADAIQNGTEEQREAVAKLAKVMNGLADDLNSSANASDKVVSVTEEAAQKTSDNVNEITRMVRQNVSTLSQAINDLDVISHVAEKNMEMSQNSKNVSGNMADEAGKLLDLVE